MVDQDDLLRQDAHQDHGVNFLLDSESSDAVPDGRQSGHSVLGRHLDGPEIPDDRLEDGVHHLGRVLRGVLMLHALTKFSKCRMNKGLKVLKKR